LWKNTLNFVIFTHTQPESTLGVVYSTGPTWGRDTPFSPYPFSPHFFLPFFLFPFIMAAHEIGQAIIFLPCGCFLLSIFYLSFSLPYLSGHRLDVSLPY